MRYAPSLKFTFALSLQVILPLMTITHETSGLGTFINILRFSMKKIVLFVSLFIALPSLAAANGALLFGSDVVGSINGAGPKAPASFPFIEGGQKNNSPLGKVKKDRESQKIMLNKIQENKDPTKNGKVLEVPKSKQKERAEKARKKFAKRFHGPKSDHNDSKNTLREANKRFVTTKVGFKGKKLSSSQMPSNLIHQAMGGKGGSAADGVTKRVHDAKRKLERSASKKSASKNKQKLKPKPKKKKKKKINMREAYENACVNMYAMCEQAIRDYSEQDNFEPTPEEKQKLQDQYDQCRKEMISEKTRGPKGSLLRVLSTFAMLRPGMTKEVYKDAVSGLFEMDRKFRREFNELCGDNKEECVVRVLFPKREVPKKKPVPKTKKDDLDLFGDKDDIEEIMEDFVDLDFTRWDDDYY